MGPSFCNVLDFNIVSWRALPMTTVEAFKEQSGERLNWMASFSSVQEERTNTPIHCFTPQTPVAAQADAGSQELPAASKVCLQEAAVESKPRCSAVG